MALCSCVYIMSVLMTEISPDVAKILSCVFESGKHGVKRSRGNCFLELTMHLANIYCRPQKKPPFTYEVHLDITLDDLQFTYYELEKQLRSQQKPPLEYLTSSVRVNATFVGNDGTWVMMTFIILTSFFLCVFVFSRCVTVCIR